MLELKENLVMIGAGRMGGALLLGMLDRGLDAKRVVVQDPSPPDEINDALGKRNVRIVAKSKSTGAPISVIILAVKPQVMQDILPGVAAAYAEPDTLVISIAAGLTLQNLAAPFAANTAIVRAMPNTPAAIGHGMTVCVANTHVSDKQRKLCTSLMQCAGEIAWLEDEANMDAVTAVSGSGPAYVFYLAECMAKAGIDAGLDPILAHRLSRETIFGAGALLKSSGEDAATLRQNVTSKGGTTAAAMNVLMRSDPNLQSLIDRAIKAAIHRAQELAKGE